MATHEASPPPADSAFAQQSAAVRALAIPEILEKVLYWADDYGLLRARRVRQLWQSVSEALLLRRCHTRNLSMTENAIYIYIGAPELPFDILAMLQRKPELGSYARGLWIVFENPPSAGLEDALRAFTNLEQLLSCRKSSTWLAALHRASVLPFTSLREASIVFCVDSTAAEREDIDPVIRFLSSLGSLVSLELELATPGPGVKQSWLQAQLAGLFAELPRLEQADLALDVDCSLSLADMLPRGLKELAIDTADHQIITTLLQALADVEVLPNLTSLPQSSLGSKAGMHWSALLATWTERPALKDAEADIRHIRDIIAGQYDDESE